MTDVLAARGSSWGGELVGLIAAAVFVLFSSWIFLQRRRHDNRKDDDG